MASCPTCVRASASGPWISFSIETLAGFDASSRSNVARLSKNRSSSLFQSPLPSALQAASPRVSVIAHAIRSARCATIETGFRVASPKDASANPTGASRNTLAARYASVAARWRTTAHVVASEGRSIVSISVLLIFHTLHRRGNGGHREDDQTQRSQRSQRADRIGAAPRSGGVEFVVRRNFCQDQFLV